MNNLIDYFGKSKQTKQPQQRSKQSGRDTRKKSTMPSTQENPEDEEAVTIKEMVEQLEQFDSNPRFGPCVGISRETRWKNAIKFNLDPPPEILDWIKATGKSSSYLDKYMH